MSDQENQVSAEEQEQKVEGEATVNTEGQEPTEETNATPEQAEQVEGEQPEGEPQA